MPTKADPRLVELARREFRTVTPEIFAELSPISQLVGYVYHLERTWGGVRPPIDETVLLAQHQAHDWDLMVRSICYIVQLGISPKQVRLQQVHMTSGPSSWVLVYTGNQQVLPEALPPYHSSAYRNLHVVIEAREQLLSTSFEAVVTELSQLLVSLRLRALGHPLATEPGASVAGAMLLGLREVIARAFRSTNSPYLSWETVEGLRGMLQIMETSTTKK